MLLRAAESETKRPVLVLVRELVEGTSVKESALRSAYYRSLSDHPRQHGNNLLKTSDEAVIVGVCRALSAGGAALTQKEVIEMARAVFVHRKFPPRNSRFFSISNSFSILNRLQMERRSLVFWVHEKMGKPA